MFSYARDQLARFVHQRRDPVEFLLHPLGVTVARIFFQQRLPQAQGFIGAAQRVPREFSSPSPPKIEEKGANRDTCWYQFFALD
ncbi:MAG: hypothetical protein U0694_01580 [Anaerolineae bacterium]